MNYYRSQKLEFTITERSNLILSMQHSLRYLHHCFLKCAPSSREYWLSRIRETYALLRRIDFCYSIEDRYSALVKGVTTERL